jgi:hypothetical protein
MRLISRGARSQSATWYSTPAHSTRSGFFTLLELMAANLRSLLSAYAGLWTFPAPAEIPTDLADPEVRLEIRRRLAPVQLELFGPAPTA